MLGATPDWRPSAPRAYCYLLGVYLGGGCLNVQSEGSACLIVVLDSGYPGIVSEVEVATGRVLPDAPVRSYRIRGERAVRVHARHPALPFAFPQHGPGRKHLRTISLVDWQLELTERYPRELLCGLIHSDGCRTVNRFTTKLPSGRVATYEYPRYFFSNLSEDIRWTRPNPRNISIAHRAGVAFMDEFVGAKD
jgi:hypothetical protein